MAARRSARTLVRAPKRSTFWAGASGQFALTTGAVSTAPIVTEATLENVPDPTLIRIHGEIFVIVTARTAAQDGAIIDFGMIPQSAAAIAAGVGSMPLPGTDVGSSWIYHKRIAVRSNIAPPNGTDIGGNHRFQVDNKAMRKFSLNQGLQLVVQNTVLTGTITVSISFAFRLLFKR